MRTLLVFGLLTLACAPLGAQKSLLFTGRFPHVSLDDVNERAGGSISKLEEFDITMITPGVGAFARSFWLPTTTMQTVMGDAYNDANYTRFNGIKTYFERWNFAAPFVKVVDQANCTWDKVFWTVRDNAVNKNFTVKTTNGTATAVIQPGDFFHFTKNGNVEFFITQTLIMKAAGVQGGTFAPGASAICQDPAGNLYYSPAEGGHYVTANTGTPVYQYDGSIIMIRAQDITYDAFGNVQDVVADSAFVIFAEVLNGNPTVRQMMTNSLALNRDGNAIATSANLVGLALDPNGGTVTAAVPWGTNQTYEVVPNFIWTDDNGGFAGTIFSSQVNPNNNLQGSVAVINGVTMGSLTVAADGSYLGVKLDYANFQPTLMGLAVIDTPANPPFLADAPNHGAILTTDVNIDWDFYAGPGALVAAVLSVGPTAANQVPFGIDASFLLLGDSFRCIYGLTTQVASMVVGVANPGGYANLQLPKPTQAGLTGLALIVHGVKFTSTPLGFAISNPVISQFK